MLTKLCLYLDLPPSLPAFWVSDHLWEKTEDQVLAQVEEHVNQYIEDVLWVVGRTQFYWELTEPVVRWLKEDTDVN